jgi:hypothetical protein
MVPDACETAGAARSAPSEHVTSAVERRSREAAVPIIVMVGYPK